MADAMENEQVAYLLLWEAEERNRMNELRIPDRDHKFSVFIDRVVTSALGEERANLVLQKAAESLRSDMYKYKEETIEMFLKRKNMEFLRQEFYGVDETDNQRYREAVSVYRLIRQFMTDEEQARLWAWDI